ncbi:carboxymuconolactone decarboxylase family protein [Alkalicoccus luteus]|uniref:Carboxymuconolactone decarboxylase-like domain-containing protein n=1 Tax=Alkalicoccus luteus TaxID=1237094 RepID=A0A969TVB0_9BACI|nr:carboxymuconolactone decarboxylase family protein [Alkalicoccus luteus]NJP36174.1 hypothetical protein [Alkalicoccus luteus]
MEDILYKKSHFSRLGELKEHAPQAFEAFVQFDQQALAPGALSRKQKELIAVAAAHITGCPYCIDLHTAQVKEAGASIEEVSEAIFVATALKAGSALAHSVNAMNSYDEA